MMAGRYAHPKKFNRKPHSIRLLNGRPFRQNKLSRAICSPQRPLDKLSSLSPLLDFKPNRKRDGRSVQLSGHVPSSLVLFSAA